MISSAFYACVRAWASHLAGKILIVFQPGKGAPLISCREGTQQNPGAFFSAQRSLHLSGKNDAAAAPRNRTCGGGGDRHRASARLSPPSVALSPTVRIFTDRP